MPRRSNPQPQEDSLFEPSATAVAAPSAANPPGDPPASGGGNNGNGSGNGHFPPGGVALHEAAQTRYLNYALSVITSRALPDVRDGLKPVQRRILFTMWQQSITADAKHRKCAKVVGDVMGNYHPHGDSAIYDALVRMAQPFVMNHGLVDGSGNFGSMDGDTAAAMRYTECRLTPIAAELLTEIDQQTVPLKPNYDGTKEEPVVLPARFPNLLVNGSTGIAVGMATNIPPHNLAEVGTALLKLLDNPELKPHQLAATIKGPDFPTGGQIITPPADLREIYKTGTGTVRVRATWELGPARRSAKVLNITSVPYGVNKAFLVEQIGQLVISRRMPLLLDVRDLSTDDVRIELEIKRDADEAKVLAYLYRHTQLQANFNVNLTALVPTENEQVGRPQRCDLREILQHFLNFRLEVVTHRLENELAQLQRRIHILEGFEAVFDALDEIIKLIRKSEGKADAAAKIMARFKLDADQTDAILELKLYRLAKLEILVIQQELTDKRKRAKEIKKLLDEKDAQGRWNLVRQDIQHIIKTYGVKRRTQIAAAVDEPEYSADDFIVAEDNVVIVTRDGWIKRQKEVRDLAGTRLREGDVVLTAQAGSTRAAVAFLTNYGVAYTCRIIDVPATTGHGEPIQKFFKLRDGERVVAAFSLDPRSVGELKAAKEGAEPPTHALAVSSDGFALRFSLEGFLEPSTRSGRRYARPKEGAEIIGVEVVHGKETVIAATREARAMLCRAKEVNFLSGPGKGVMLIKISDDDRVLAFRVALDDRDTLTAKTSMGGEQRINTGRYEVTGRGGKGREIIKRGQFIEVIAEEATPPVLLEETAEDDEE